MRGAYIVFLIILVFVPVVRATVFSRRRDRVAYSEVDIYNSVQIACTLGMAVVLCGRRAIRSNWLIRTGPTYLLMIYTVFCGVSSTWSRQPTYTAFRAFELGVLLFFMGHVLNVINHPRTALLWLCRFAALVAVLGYSPGLLRGEILQHTNGYTTAGAFGAVLALASVRRRVLGIDDIKYSLIACVITVALGTSSASNVSLLVGILMIMVSSRYHSISMGRLLLVSVAAFIVFSSAIEVIRPYLFPRKDAENIRTLTGRLELWADFLDAVRERPLLGYGFASGEKGIVVLGRDITNWTHNSIVSVLVNTGIVGLLLFVGGFWVIGYTLYRADVLGHPYAYPILMAITVGSLNSLSYPVTGSAWVPATTPFMGLIAYTAIFVSCDSYRVVPCVYMGNRRDTGLSRPL